MRWTRHDLRLLARGLAFLSPWLIGFAAFALLPIGLSLYFSFCDYSTLRPPMFVGLENYRELLGDAVFARALRTTVLYAAMALPAGMMVSLGLAILLNQPVRGQAVYRTIIFLPSLVPAVASAMVWLWIFNGSRAGLLNYLLSLAGVEAQSWLSSAHLILPSLVFMSLWGVGHTVIIYLAGLQDVPRELYEAAAIDGATGWRRLWHVTLPMLSPVIFFNLVMGIIGSWQVFTVPQIMVPGGGTDRAGYFYVMYLYDSAFRDQRMGYASAMAWVLLLIILALTAVAFWTARRWVHYQGK